MWLFLAEWNRGRIHAALSFPDEACSKPVRQRAVRPRLHLRPPAEPYYRQGR
ncbi:hypothetical protein B8V81_0488 [Paenibacillus pasadenensis]|uniref:Uncharacterized protein n=1 Tax=Paenibacillus pasadenensis TaxID=217090 RepID=A0A2N5NDC7_9BACL|nr:hypothetical protein B8V81_0488 [Paenibacillus pasadenensis]